MGKKVRVNGVVRQHDRGRGAPVTTKSTAPVSTPPRTYTAPKPGTTKLFCYGTLNVHEVQRQVFGEAMQGTPGVLTNFELRMWPESWILYIERKPGETVSGKTYELTDEQIKRCDAYEGAGYERIWVYGGELGSCQVYIKK